MSLENMRRVRDEMKDAKIQMSKEPKDAPKKVKFTRSHSKRRGTEVKRLRCTTGRAVASGVCDICKRKFKSGQGLRVHMAKVHRIHGPQEYISMRVFQYFRFLENRKWTNAGRFLEWVRGRKVEEGWKRGYVNGLRGMLIALKESHSSPLPYILEIKNYDKRRLKEAQEEFLKLSSKPDTRYDVVRVKVLGHHKELLGDDYFKEFFMARRNCEI